jgi:glycosyltransferase involved in cell wall biosynthesis
VKVALLTEIPAPYRVPLFNALTGKDLDLTVVFLSASDPRRAYRVYERESRFRHDTLSGREVSWTHSWTVLNRGTGRALARIGPDLVIVGGWNQPAYWQAARWARRRSLPVVCWVESTARDRRSRSPLLASLRRRFVGGCTAFIVPGGASRDYLASLGVEGDRIAIAPNAVDQEIFGARSASLRPERNALRADRGIDAPAVLYVGRLDPDKGVDVLLEAMDGIDADLVIAGDGPERRRLQGRAGSRTRFVGRLDRDELVPFYALADLFVLPSRSEQWGMVLNEAAAAGLPLVATNAPGAAWELIEDGVNGFRVPAGDAGALRAAIRKLLEDEPFAEAARMRSLELARRYTPGAWAEAVAGLCHRLEAGPSRS